MSFQKEIKEGQDFFFTHPEIDHAHASVFWDVSEVFWYPSTPTVAGMGRKNSRWKAVDPGGGLVGILLECSYLVQKLLVVCRALPTVLRVLGPEHW